MNEIISKMINFDTMGDAYLKLIAQYLFFLSSFFLFYSIFDILYFGDILVFVVLLFTALFFCFCLIGLIWIKKKVKKFRKALKSFVVVNFILLTLIVSFFYVYTWKDTGIEYFYFSLLFTIPFFFNYKNDYFSILLIVVIIVINFVSCLYFSFDFIPRSSFIEESDRRIVYLVNIILVIGTFLIIMHFIAQKDKIIRGLLKETEVKEDTIVDLVKVNHELMKQQIIINHLTDENISEIIELAENDSPIFLERFQIYFPEFIPSILHLNPDLIHSELHICALMRLNFDTKKIALCTNSSVRAIESRKYRIRKKLQIPSNININSFILRV